jgi:hypothetical protein
LLSKFKTFSHASKLTNDQALAAVQFLGKEILPELIPQMLKNPDVLGHFSAEEAEASLAKELGGKLTETLGSARTALNAFKSDGIPDIADRLENLKVIGEDGRLVALGNHPFMVKLFADIGERMASDVSPSGGGSFTESLEDVDKEIAAIMKSPDHPMNSGYKVGGAKEMAYLQKLFEKKAGILNRG